MAGSDLINGFINAMKTDRNLSPRTLKAYELDLRGFSNFYNNGDLILVSSKNVQDFVLNSESRRLSSTSIRRKLITLKVFYKYLYKKGIIDKYPLENTGYRFKTPQLLPRVIPKNDIFNILIEARNSVANFRKNNPRQLYYLLRNLIIVELLFSLGLRIDELTGINIEDFDLNSGTLFVKGKGRKERFLYLSSVEIKDLIRDYLPFRDLIAGESGPLILNKSGKRLSNGSVGRIFMKLCRNAGISRHYTPHCLRHSMATLLIENGADVRSVQEILGHSSICTTEIYLHVSQKRKAEVLGKFNERNNISLGRINLPIYAG
jgi:integrase/recombinase XerD